jgi:hypothetical protein
MMPLSADEQPTTWHPISDLPLIGWMIRDMLAGAKEQYESLVPCRPTPHVLDDHLIGRVFKLYREKKEDLWFYQEQLARWKKEKLSAGQRKEVEALAGELSNYAAMIDSVLALAEELSDGTIDKVMAKSDLTAGVEALLGRPTRAERAELHAALTAEQRDIAARIDAKVQTLTAQDCDDFTILDELRDHQPGFKSLLDFAASHPGILDKISRQFPGFYVYAKLIETIAAGIASGEIEVPPPAEDPAMRKVQPFLPKLTVNRPFMSAFLSEKTPCFALGLVEERKRPYAFLALRPDESIPPETTSRGFRFGHSLIGNADYEVVHFAFEFYGFQTYNVLLNPNNKLVRAVLTRMVESGDYFIFAVDPNNSAASFRTDIGQGDLAGLKANFPRIQRSVTTHAQYRKAVASFARNPDPPGGLLDWVCRDSVESLDLTKDRFELTPARD